MLSGLVSPIAITSIGRVWLTGSIRSLGSPGWTDTLPVHELHSVGTERLWVFALGAIILVARRTTCPSRIFASYQVMTLATAVKRCVNRAEQSRTGRAAGSPLFVVGECEKLALSRLAAKREIKV